MNKYYGQIYKFHSFLESVNVYIGLNVFQDTYPVFPFEALRVVNLVGLDIVPQILDLDRNYGTETYITVNWFRVPVRARAGLQQGLDFYII